MTISIRNALVAGAALAAMAGLQAQTAVGIPITIKKAFVVDNLADERSLVLDVGKNDMTTGSELAVTLPADASLTGKNKKPLPLEAFAPGAEVEVRGEKFGGELRVTSITARTDRPDVEKIEGVYEAFDEKTGAAIIGGRRVTLAPGVTIMGKEQWKGRQFPSYQPLPLGSWTEVQGTFTGTMGLAATVASVKPNLPSSDEQGMLSAIRSGLKMAGREVPAAAGSRATRLSGGAISIGSETFRLVQNLEVQAYVTRVGYAVLPDWIKDIPENDPARVTFRFLVVDDNTANAFALPTGEIVVHSGLIRLLDNEAQLAGVLSHEVSHVLYRHAARSARNQARGDLVGAGLTEASRYLPFVGNGLAKRVTEVGLVATLSQLGQTYEAEADRSGMHYMTRAGYSPREAPKVWRKLAEPKTDALTALKEKVFNFAYGSHPLSGVRMSRLHRELRTNYGDTDFTKLTTGDAKAFTAIVQHLQQ